MALQSWMALLALLYPTTTTWRCSSRLWRPPVLVLPCPRCSAQELAGYARAQAAAAREACRPLEPQLEGASQAAAAARAALDQLSQRGAQLNDTVAREHSDRWVGQVVRPGVGRLRLGQQVGARGLWHRNRVTPTPTSAAPGHMCAWGMGRSRRWHWACSTWLPAIPHRLSPLP